VTEIWDNIINETIVSFSCNGSLSIEATVEELCVDHSESDVASAMNRAIRSNMFDINAKGKMVLTDQGFQRLKEIDSNITACFSEKG